MFNNPKKWGKKRISKSSFTCINPNIQRDEMRTFSGDLGEIIISFIGYLKYFDFNI